MSTDNMPPNEHTFARAVVEMEAVGKRAALSYALLVLTNPGGRVPEDVAASIKTAYRDSPSRRADVDPDAHGQALQVVTDAILRVGHFAPSWERFDRFAQPVTALGLTYRAVTRLRKAGINTVRQLVGRTAPDLLAMSGFGYTSLRDVEEKLSLWGLGLEMRVPPDAGG